MKRIGWQVLAVLMIWTAAARAQEETAAADALPAPLMLYLEQERADWRKLEGQNPLVLRLCDASRSGRETCRTPAQPMRLEGRKAAGIALSPAVRGEWRFDYGYRLTFTPAEPWRAGQAYAVTVAEGALPPFLKLAGSSLGVVSEPLRPDIGAMTYMQDPSDVTKRYVATQIRFNYPMHTASAEERIRFAYEDGGEVLASTAVWDGDRQEVNLTTPIGPLDDQPRWLRVTLAPGMMTRDGHGRLTAAGDVAKRLSQRVEVPGRASYLQVRNAEALVVKNARYVPEQVVTLEFNAPIRPEDALAHLDVLLLPRDKPSAFEGRSPSRNHAWSSMNEITDAVREASSAVTLTPLPAAEERATTLSFRYQATPGRYLALTVKSGLPAEGGFVLGRPYARILKSPALPREVTIQSEGALLSLSGDRTVSVVSLGVNALEVEFARIHPDRIAHLVSQTQGDFARPEFLDDYRFNQYNLAEVFRETIPLAEGGKDEPRFTAIDLGKHLEKGFFGGARQGLFLLTLREKDGKAKDQRLILVSDLGFMVKHNRDETRDVFVMDITGGKPVSGASVQVVGLNGQPVLSVKTDGQGRATLPNLTGYENEKRPVAFFVRRGNDLSFMPFGRYDRELNLSRFDTDGLRNTGEGLRAFVFSDRGIYRPGEEVRLGLIVRQSAWSQPMEGLPLWVDIRNARGQVVESRLVKLNAEGFLDFRYQTREDGATGVYQASVSIARDEKRSTRLGAGVFRVEEFQPDTMKIAAAFNKPEAEGWLAPEGLEASVTLHHLFGDAASGRRVKARIALAPGDFSFRSLPDFHFHNAARTDKSFEEDLPERQTDADGKATFDLNLARFGDATFRLTFFAEGFEPDSGRSVKTLKTALISSLPYVVGYKADGDLGYIPLNTPRAVTFRAVGRDMKPLSADSLTLAVLRLDRIATLTRRHDGTMAYDTKIKETQISSREFAIGESDATVDLDTATPGGYALVVKNAGGRVLSRAEYQVIGEGNVTGAITRDAALDIRLPRETYRSGEVVEVAILAPYAGAGIVTLETDKVEAFQWFRADTRASVQRIAIPRGFEGRGFVSVHFIRSLESREIFASPFAYATRPITVDLDRRLNAITLSAPDTVRPGEVLPINYHTEVPGKIVVFAVDEGILNFARYQLPDPLRFFFLGRALEVATSQIFDLIMPEFSILKSLSASGGDGWINDGKNLNPFKRKTEPPVACWSGVIEAKTGPAVFECPIPSYFNGAVRVMAVAVASESLGSGQRTATVRGPFILSPNAPLFAAPGDVFEASLTIRNHLAGSGPEAKVSLTVVPSEHLALVDTPAAEHVIAEGAEKTLTFRVRALEKLGSASLSFTAGSGGESGTREITLSVRPATPRFTEILSGYAPGPSIQRTVESARTLFPELSHGEAMASSLPVSLVPALARYLDGFPYGCTEQLISKAVPYVTLTGSPEFAKTLNLDGQTVESRAAALIGALRERQGDDGGFGPWSDMEESHDFITVYAAHVLTVARERQVPVAEDMWGPLLRSLRTMAGRVPVSLDDARNKAHAVYLLVRNGEVAANYLPPIVDYLKRYEPGALRHDVAALYLASAYSLMQMTPEAEAIVATFSPAAEQAPAAFHEYNSRLIQQAQAVYLKSLYFKAFLGDADRAAMFRVANAIGSGDHNTLASAFSILAFDAYSRLSAEGDVIRDITLTATGYDGAAVPLTPEGERTRGAVFAGPVRSVSFGAESPLGLFYQFTTTGFDRTAALTPVENGLELSRRYLRADGSPAETVAVGEEVTVEIAVRSGSQDAVEHLAVVDLLPGGFEPVNPAAPANAESAAAAAESAGDAPWLPVHASFREDRVLLFGRAAPAVETYRYKIKAVSRGDYTVPPVYGESMYRLDIRARGAASRIRVE